MAPFKVGDRVEVTWVGRRGTLVEIRPDKGRGESYCDHVIRLDQEMELKLMSGRTIPTNNYRCFAENLRRLTDLERLSDETKEEV